MPPSSSNAGAASRSASKRLIKELETWSREQKEEKGIERLGPVSEGDLMEWEAVINGRGIGQGYDGLYPLYSRLFAFTNIFKEGRWLVNISIPSTYPLAPPKMTFVTPIVHPNIALQNGEICLDLLKDAWTPAYSVLECVRAVRMLLGCPETDSPLNVDVAALLRSGDVIGTRKLVEFWCRDSDSRYEGP
ncbi:peroxin-4 [Fusarium longipes]|uniref:Peroxin-4 n=1 Tax=Fusarium longipes TaxID=694270 RepID=A0A395TA46_9HYPO|nr:peroxin-4 [Fusarium longipes]